MAAATVPQPFKYHPTPGIHTIHTLAADATLLKSVNQASGDVLIVPPPLISVNGETERMFFVLMARLTAVGIAPIAEGDIQFILKTVDGREAIQDENGAGMVVGDIFADDTIGLVLNEEIDLGYFVRVTVPDVVVDVFGQFIDARNANAIFKDVTAIFPEKDLVFTHDEFGRVQVPATVGELSSTFQVQNFDTVDHVVRFFISDGTNEVEITSAVTPTLAGNIDTANLLTGLPYMPAGWSFYAALDTGEIVTTNAPRVLFSSLRTNAAARTNQAGAY